MSRHDSARSTCRACRAVLFQYGGRRTSYSARLYKFSRSYALTHTQILFVPSNKIIVYSNKLVNNLHITITLYKLHNKLSCESRLSRSSCRTCRAVLFDKLDTAKMHGLDTSNVSSRVVSRTWGAKWNLGLFDYFRFFSMTLLYKNGLFSPKICQ